jgi:hypothetical protein
MMNNIAQTGLGALNNITNSAASQTQSRDTASQLDAISQKNQQTALDAARRDQQMKETEALCDALKTGPKVMQASAKETLQGA